MKRTVLIRKRRYLLRAVAVGFAAALLLPATALARIDESGAGASVDPFAADSVSAEDAHGLSALHGYVLPAADRAAVKQAGSAATTGTAPKAPAPTVTVTGGSTVDWTQVSLFATLGLLGISGLAALGLAVNRRGTPVVHP